MSTMPLTPEQVDQVVTYLMEDGSREAILLAGMVNNAMGASARGRAQQGAEETLTIPLPTWVGGIPIDPEEVARALQWVAEQTGNPYNGVTTRPLFHTLRLVERALQERRDRGPYCRECRGVGSHKLDCSQRGARTKGHLEDPPPRDWIPTAGGERLPPDDVVVWAMDSGGHVQALFRRGPRWWFPDGSMYVYFTPLFWQPKEVRR